VLRVLVVDDQVAMREALKALLTGGGHNVTAAENGKVAQDILESDKFDLVISDIQMPIVNGIELLTWIKEQKGIPVILVTGFSHILETQQAFELGAADFLTKPFSFKAITRAIDKLFSPKNAKDEQEDPETTYCKIPIDDFVSGASVQISVYIKLSDSKYIRVAHTGDQIPTDRVENYKAKGLEYLYAKKTDFARLVGFNMNVSKVLQKNSKISTEKKLRFLRYTTELVLENAVVNGIDSKAFKQAADCLELTLSVVTENQGLFEMLEILNNHADWLYAHSLGVSMYSVMIAQKMGWKGQTTLFKLGVGGLFHDIGQKEIAADLLAKSRPSLSQDERRQIETHTSRGKDILLTLNGLSEDILQIVYEHHEDCTGRGYPRRVSSERIHPLAKVVAVADRFCYLAMVGPQSQGKSAWEALKQMEAFHSQEIDKTAVNALRSLCVKEPISSI
jgi:putative nucleotidyltransferase with HDIG domain